MTNFKHLNLINVETCENLKKLHDYYENTRDFYSRFDEVVKKLNLDIDPAIRYDMIFNLSHKYLIRKILDDEYSITARSGMNNLDLKTVDLYSRIIFKMQAYNFNEEDQYIEFMGAKFKECNSCRESIANIPDYYIDYDIDPIDEICNKLEDQFMVYFSLSNRKINSIRILAIKKNRDVLFTVLIDE